MILLVQQKTGEVQFIGEIWGKSVFVSPSSSRGQCIFWFLGK
jgi:hypothetical protein